MRIPGRHGSWFPGAGLYTGIKAIFNFVRSHHTPFHSGCTIWPSHQKSIIPTSPSPGQLLLFSVFLIAVILRGMRKCCLTVVLIWSSLMTSDVEHSWFCLLAICLSSVDRCLLNSSAHILTGLFDFLLLGCRSSFDILDIKSLIRYTISKYFLPFGGLPFHFFVSVLWCAKGFLF